MLISKQYENANNANFGSFEKPLLMMDPYIYLEMHCITTRAIGVSQFARSPKANN